MTCHTQFTLHGLIAFIQLSLCSPWASEWVYFKPAHSALPLACCWRNRWEGWKWLDIVLQMRVANLSPTAPSHTGFNQQSVTWGGHWLHFFPQKVKIMMFRISVSNTHPKLVLGYFRILINIHPSEDKSCQMYNKHHNDYVAFCAIDHQVVPTGAFCDFQSLSSLDFLLCHLYNLFFKNLASLFYIMVAGWRFFKCGTWLCLSVWLN